jgi:putative acetyltransferase
MTFRVRPETTADRVAVRRVHQEAFGQYDEAWIVDALRRGGYVRVSLVAELGGQVVGHVLFSDLPIIAQSGTVPALALAPLAVLPEFQKQGIGSELVRRGLETCRADGHRLVLVVGHPHYYPRFGFSAEKAACLDSPYPGPSFMAAELVPGAFEQVRGRVVYPPPFEEVPQIRPARAGDLAEWIRMRSLLWPDCTAAEQAAETAAFFDPAQPGWLEPCLAIAVFVAARPTGRLCGFLEATLRPYAEDCVTRPVGYVEGWFVDADQRRLGIGRGLLTAAEEWAAARGCREMASDAAIDNTVSRTAHVALGFEESSRAVHLRKWLARPSETPERRRDSPRRLNLTLVNGTFTVCKLDGAAPVPAWAAAGNFCSITRTADELSVVCRQDAVPEGVRCEKNWRCFRVVGSISFATIGVLNSLTAPLAEAGISVFAVSTFDTDYLLVKENDWEPAVSALRRRGHHFHA